MATIKEMNRFLTDYLIPKGSKERNHIAYKIGFEFHDNWSMLMLAVGKAIGEGKEISYDDKLNKTFWYAIYPEIESVKPSTWENQKYVVKGYYCAFTKDGCGRIGHGVKFNKDFLKKTQILAIHYSLYRLVKNGLEY
jgi:hypothetical protein